MGRCWRVVMRKEVREAVRDRRSLGSALLYAVWGPAVMAVAIMALARDRGADQPLTLPVAGAEHAEALSLFLREKRVTVLHTSGDVGQLVRARDVPVALIVDDSYRSRFVAQRPARVTLVYDSSWSESSARTSRVRALLAEYGRRVGDTRLILRGVAPSAVTPLELADRDLSTAAGRAATVLGMLPIFLVVAAFVGGMGLAADTIAGERERRSLDALLSHPVSRWALVVGKWAAAALVALVTVLLTLVSTALLLRHPRVQALDLPLGLSAAEAATMGLVLAPLAVMVTAGQLLVALFARTYKEAQTQLSLLIFLPMLPGFLFAFGSIPIATWMTWTPVLGQQLMLSEILRGVVPAAPVITGLALITLGVGAALAGVTTHLLTRENRARRTRSLP